VRARDLVRGKSLVRRGFQARFTHIFVDEFQDTDPRCRRRSCCSWLPSTPGETDWRRVRHGGAAGCFS
jgi:hypothetical protein